MLRQLARNLYKAAFLIWQTRGAPIPNTAPISCRFSSSTKKSCRTIASRSDNCDSCWVSNALNAPSKDQPIDLRQEIEAIELERITMALELADGIVSEAARLLTLKRTTLIEKMRKDGVQAVA